jgi:hypothetical protein
LVTHGKYVPPDRVVSSSYFKQRLPIFEKGGPQMPFKLAKHVATTLGSPVRPYTHSAFRETPAGRLWIEATERVICLVDETGAANCSNSTPVPAHGIALGVAYPRKEGLEFSLLGLAPRGTKSVPVKIGSRRHWLPVRNLVYGVSAKKRIDLVNPSP